MTETVTGITRHNAADDAVRPPCALPATPLAGVMAGIDACVHCGFCLQSCPTYRELGDENDSPRGRILLMRLLAEGELAPEDVDVRSHIDRCLGCRACETACPSGVPYGELLEATRATLAQVRAIPRVARLILWVFARPRLLALVLAAARALRATRAPALLARTPGLIGYAAAMLAATRQVLRPRPYAPGAGGEQGQATLLHGCVMRGLFAHANRATERVLATNGYECVESPGQRCCGALHAHAGDLEGARALARANIQAFERSGTAIIAVNAAGCGAALKEYGHLLRDDPAWSARAAAVAGRVRDVSELLVDAGPVHGAALPGVGPVAYDAPCHLHHAQRVTEAPLSMLAAIPGLDVAPLPGADQCCGSAGIYNLLEPELAGRVLRPKLGEVETSDARLVATGNPGCLMHIGAGLLRARSDVRCVHPVELLDASYAKREAEPDAKLDAKLDAEQEAEQDGGSGDGTRAAPTPRA